MKNLQRVLFSLCVMIFMSHSAMSQLAANTSPEKKPATVVQKDGKFTDANKNGVCDNFEAKKAGAKCATFTDKNGDGVCDNKGKNCQGKGSCCGQGNGCGQGQGTGNCCGKGVQGQGCGNGHQHRHGCQGNNAQPNK